MIVRVSTTTASPRPCPAYLPLTLPPPAPPAAAGEIMPRHVPLPVPSRREIAGRKSRGVRRERERARAAWPRGSGTTSTPSAFPTMATTTSSTSSPWVRQTHRHTERTRRGLLPSAGLALQEIMVGTAVVGGPCAFLPSDYRCPSLHVHEARTGDQVVTCKNTYQYIIVVAVAFPSHLTTTNHYGCTA